MTSRTAWENIDGPARAHNVCDVDLQAVAPQTWPQLWRFTLIGLAVLILSACQSPTAPQRPHAAMQGPAMAGLPPEAYTGSPAYAPQPIGPPGMEMGIPMPYAPVGPWQPPGIAGPWPQDEYVCDGGDANLPADVSRQGQVRGVEAEDALAHFETLDGQKHIQPSNRVCLYAPRFAAVRQVVDLEESRQRDRAAGIYKPARLAAPRLSQQVANHKQQIQAEGEMSARPAEVFRRRQGGDVISSRLSPEGFVGAYKAYENATAIRTGQMIEAEGAHLARGVNAALAWTRTQTVQVMIDRRAAMAEIGDEKLQQVFTVNEPPEQPRLRLIKVASTPFAEPGDEVAFTLRFDNLGNRLIGNVTIIDSLSPRLEFIPGSAQCSVDAQFSTQANESDSTLVRCEITDPVKPGKGGVIRFRCRVR